MTQSEPQQAFFDLWKKQMEEGADFWGRMTSEAGRAASGPDPLQMWRPFMEQAAATWTKTVKDGAKGTSASDPMAQGKAFVDQWVAAWDKLFAETMQTEAFAQAMGKHLDQWLSAQAPVRKASADATETMLQSLGVPSRNQVIGLARQLMDLDDRIEAIEEHLAALREQLRRSSGTSAAARSAKAPPDDAAGHPAAASPKQARAGRTGKSTSTDRKAGKS